jgi:N-acetylornithine carbamoyltransferase
MELAAVQLGAFAATLTSSQGLWGFAWKSREVMDGAAAEHIREAIGVLSRYYDALGVRCFASMTDYEEDRTDAFLGAVRDASGVPVINLESAFYHPCQALADAAALQSRFPDLRGRRFVLSWADHPKPLPMAVPNSVLLMAARCGMDVTVAAPAGFDLDEDLVNRARAVAEAAGGTVDSTSNLDDAVEGAHVVYAKGWGGRTLYTDPDRESRERIAMREWRISSERMARTSEGVFMHCLPVRRNVVVDDEVLEGTQSIHLLQAEMRLHAQKAILEWMWDLGRDEKTPGAS